MTTGTPAIAKDLAPHGTLRASINLGNPVLAQGTPTAPAGITVDLAREIAARLDVPVELLCFDAARKSYEAMAEAVPTSASWPSSPRGRPRSRSRRRTS